MSYETKYLQIVACLPDRDNRLISCLIARWVLTEFKVEDPRLWEAVEVSERYADGRATLEELRAAREAADRAAREAARSAAGAAAWAAVWAAAGAAAWAAQAAVRAAARDDTYKLFFEWALELAIGEKVAA